MKITKRELKETIEEHIRLVNEQSGSRTVELVGNALISAAEVLSGVSDTVLRWSDSIGSPLLTWKNGLENIGKLVQTYISLDARRQAEKRADISSAIAAIITKMQAAALDTNPGLSFDYEMAPGAGIIYSPALKKVIDKMAEVRVALIDNALTQAVIGDVAEFLMLAMSASQHGVSIGIDDSDVVDDDAPQLASPADEDEEIEIDITDEAGVNESNQLLTQGELRRLITEAFLPNLRSAPIPLNSAADPEFAAAIKGKQSAHTSPNTLARMVREEIERVLSESTPRPTMDTYRSITMDPPPHDGKTDGEEWADDREGHEGITWVWEPARWVTDGKIKKTTQAAFDGE